MKQFASILFFTVITASVFTSCVKESSFPTTPIIAFDRFEIVSADTADCYITFTDGDGDIGIMDGDTSSGPDLIMLYLFKDSDGEFYPYDETPGTVEFDTLYYNNRVPNITPDGQFKALDGEIKIKLRSAPIFSPFHTVVKFDITLRDRAGNWSNTVTTNEITIP